AHLGMFKKTVAIREETVGGTHLHAPALTNIPGHQAVKMFVLFQAVGADVLDRRCTGCSRYERQVLQSAPPLGHAMRHKVVPGLSRLYLYQDGLRVLIHEFHATCGDMTH